LQINSPSFFIIGPGRSGNTLLRRLLVEQTNACIPDEIYVIGDIIRLSLKGLKWSDFVTQSIKAISNQEDGDLLTTDFDALENYLLGLDRNMQLVSTLISTFYQYECRSFQKIACTIGDKTPLNTFSTLDLMKIFPRAKFAFMLRFPIDVVSSYVESGIYHSYEQAIDRVQRSYKVYKRIRSKHSVLPVCYEELVKNTPCVLKGVVQHFALELVDRKSVVQLSDVKRHAHHEEVYKSISKKNIGKGISSMPLEAIGDCSSLVAQYFKFIKDVDACS